MSRTFLTYAINKITQIYIRSILQEHKRIGNILRLPRAIMHSQAVRMKTIS